MFHSFQKRSVAPQLRRGTFINRNEGGFPGELVYCSTVYFKVQMDCMFSLEVMVLYSTHSKMLSNVREQIVEFCAFFVPYSTWEMLKVPLG
jgi:hypothetical protein